MMPLLMACPVCFGAADSEQVQAAKVGVLVMLGFIVPLLVTIAFIARSWARRARALDASGKESVASDQPQSARSAQSFLGFTNGISAVSARSAVDLKP
jgi:hypothetical protein